MRPRALLEASAVLGVGLYLNATDGRLWAYDPGRRISPTWLGVLLAHERDLCLLLARVDGRAGWVRGTARWHAAELTPWGPRWACGGRWLTWDALRAWAVRKLPPASPGDRICARCIAAHVRRELALADAEREGERV